MHTPVAQAQAKALKPWPRADARPISASPRHTRPTDTAARGRRAPPGTGPRPARPAASPPRASRSSPSPAGRRAGSGPGRRSSSPRPAPPPAPRPGIREGTAADGTQGVSSPVTATDTPRIPRDADAMSLERFSRAFHRACRHAEPSTRTQAKMTIGPGMAVNCPGR